MKALLREPTAEQKLAITRVQDSFSVLAAAGSGKTFVLTERYCSLVKEHGFRPSQILTITFTKKAAAEMKRRIVDRLRSMDLVDEAQEAETGPIQTIHSFCERVLKENSLEAGLDPEFELLDGAESSALLQTCIRKALLVDRAQAPDAFYAIRVLAGEEGYGVTSAYGPVEKAVREILNAIRSSGFDRNFFYQRYGSASELIRWQREEMLRHFGDVVRAEVQEHPELDFSEAVLLADKLNKLGLKREAWVVASPEEVDQSAAAVTAGLVQLALEAWRLFDEELRMLQKFDFTGLEANAVTLLQQNPRVQARVAKQYPLVMVDEAQDVNPVQFKLLDCLRPQSMMLVGDDRQSIYAFRHADVDQFLARSANNSLFLTKNHRSQEGILEFVDAIFAPRFGERYRPMAPQKPLDFEDTSVSQFPGVEMWEFARPSDWVEVVAQIRRLEQLGLSRGKMAVLVRTNREAEKAANSMRALGIGVHVVSGPEKFYTRLEVHDLANTLEALVQPENDYAHLAMLRSPVVGLSLDAIVQIASSRKSEASEEGFVPKTVRELLPTIELETEGDRVKLQSALDWFIELSEVADRMPAYEILGEVFARSPFLVTLAKRRDFEPRIANARKLLSIAAARPELPTTDFAQMIREIQELRHAEGEAAFEDETGELVTISTLHKAKGLEWDVVILPDADQYKPKKAQNLAVLATKGLVAYKSGSPNIWHAFVTKVYKERDQQEIDRVMYVAATRAKKLLALGYHGKAKDGFWSIIPPSDRGRLTKVGPLMTSAIGANDEEDSAE